MSLQGKTLYYECFSGISGDMNMAAMLALGVPQDYLEGQLKLLGLEGWSLEVQKAAKKGIFGLQVNVKLGQGKFKPLATKGKLLSGPKHDHEHRTFADIRTLIEKSQLSNSIKVKSIAIFYKLAQAEGSVHNMDPELVHFHEVGAVDSIIDIVAAAICYDWLKPARVICSAVQVGGGMVHCQHGLIPVPAPAVLHLLKGAPIKTGAVQFETCTPTGAAILATLVDEFVDATEAVLIDIACGIGHRDLEIPNLVRVSLLQEASSGTKTQEASLLACNLDDMSGEELGVLIGQFLERGASDAWLTPIIMKKNRPAFVFSVLCAQADKDAFIEQLFLQTTTLGVRTSLVDKTMLERSFVKRKTSLGQVTIKRAHYKGAIIKEKAEFDDLLELAKSNHMSIASVQTLINKELRHSGAD